MRLGDEQRGAHELVDDVLDLVLRDRGQQAVQRTELAELPEHAPELGLEDHRHRDQAEGEHRLQYELRELEVREHGEAVHGHEDEDAEKQLDRACAADEDEHVVDEDRHEEDVEDVVPATALTAEQLVELIVDPAHLERLRQLFDLRGELGASVETQRLDEQLHLRLRDVAFPEAARHFAAACAGACAIEGAGASHGLATVGDSSVETVAAELSSPCDAAGMAGAAGAAGAGAAVNAVRMSASRSARDSLGLGIAVPVARATSSSSALPGMLSSAYDASSLARSSSLLSIRYRT